ncbi:Hepatocyte nuclear factor 4-gamma [Schistosoma japonicum]|nr:Hepatocyte nuclear factor 4-gamma [Schistosoma japonicum]
MVNNIHIIMNHVIVLTLHHNHLNHDFNSYLLLQQQQQQQEQHRQGIDSAINITETTTTITANDKDDSDKSHLGETTVCSIQNQHDNEIKSQSKLSSNDDNDNNNYGKQLNQTILKSGILCLICEDKATGKHYGAYSCDGCKGFFRRSVRRKHSYTCRHKRNCIVTKDKRNQCRFCRFRKCFRVGMKESAVQKERDKISNRHSTNDTVSSIQSGIDLQKLLQAEAIANCIALLQAHAGEMLILGAVWRSIILGPTMHKLNNFDEEGANSQHFKHKTEHNQDTFNVDSNNRVISRQNPQSEIADIANIIINEIYQPIHNLCLDETEIVCFRAIMFFDPCCESLSENGRLIIRSCQYLLQMELMNLMNSKLYLPKGRFGALLLLIPEFRSVTYQMINKLQIARQMDAINESDSKVESKHMKSSDKHHYHQRNLLNKVLFYEDNELPIMQSIPKLYPVQTNYNYIPSQLSSSSTSLTSSSAAVATSFSTLSTLPTVSNAHFNCIPSLNEINHITTNELNNSTVVHFDLLSKMHVTTASMVFQPMIEIKKHLKIYQHVTIQIIIPIL